MHALDAAFVRLERIFDRAFGAAANPLRHVGTLGYLMFWLLALSGLYLFIRFDTSIDGAYASIGRLSDAEWWFGGVLRSLHRYASDAFVVVVALHLLRELAAGRFRGFRAFSWISGVPLLWLLYASGVIGYWLVWDARAQFSALATAEWFHALGIGAEPMVRNFLGAEAVPNRMFSLFVFLHIGLPLALLAGMWIHVQRLGRPRTLSPRPLVAGFTAMLLALALALPAASEAPWDTARVPVSVAQDWFLLFWQPLMYATSPLALWAILGGVTAALVVLPRLARRPALPAAVVSPQNCNGCGRCVDDCPYQAVLLAPHETKRGAFQAVVMAERCAACGICAGACPSSTPFRADADLVSGIDLPGLTVNALRARLESALTKLRGDGRVVLFGCDGGPALADLADARTAALTLPCLAMLPPSFIEYALRSGAEGVLLAGCAPGECRYRQGLEITAERLSGAREPHLRASVPRERLWMPGDAVQDTASLRESLAGFRTALAVLGVPPATRPKRARVLA